jgi:hypothetical protein
VAVRFRAWAWGRSLVGFEDSNPADNIDVCLLRVLCLVRYRSLKTGRLLVQRSPTERDMSEYDLETYGCRATKKHVIGLKFPVHTFTVNVTYSLPVSRPGRDNGKPPPGKRKCVIIGKALPLQA